MAAGNVSGHRRTKAASGRENVLRNLPHNIVVPIPREIHGQKYISLATFRKNGTAVPTPVWFGEEDDKLYVMSRSDSGKYKRIRNNPQVRVASCTMRGKITGPEFAAVARILPPEDWPHARETVHRKYWLARVPFLWSKQNVYLEITFGEGQQR
jgi:PPOX class probable F420-dependent enzyme